MYKLCISYVFLVFSQLDKYVEYRGPHIFLSHFSFWCQISKRNHQKISSMSQALLIISLKICILFRNIKIPIEIKWSLDNQKSQLLIVCYNFFLIKRFLSEKRKSQHFFWAFSLLISNYYKIFNIIFFFLYSFDHLYFIDGFNLKRTIFIPTI